MPNRFLILFNQPFQRQSKITLPLPGVSKTVDGISNLPG